MKMGEATFNCLQLKHRIFLGVLAGRFKIFWSESDQIQNFKISYLESGWLLIYRTSGDPINSACLADLSGRSLNEDGSFSEAWLILFYNLKTIRLNGGEGERQRAAVFGIIIDRPIGVDPVICIPEADGHPLGRPVAQTEAEAVDVVIPLGNRIFIFISAIKSIRIHLKVSYKLVIHGVASHVVPGKTKVLV